MLEAESKEPLVLPVEIIEVILNIVFGWRWLRTLANFAQTCQLWAHVARPNIWNAVTVFQYDFWASGGALTANPTTVLRSSELFEGFSFIRSLRLEIRTEFATACHGLLRRVRPNVVALHATIWFAGSQEFTDAFWRCIQAAPHLEKLLVSAFVPLHRLGRSQRILVSSNFEGNRCQFPMRQLQHFSDPALDR